MDNKEQSNFSNIDEQANLVTNATAQNNEQCQEFHQEVMMDDVIAELDRLIDEA
jgi:hypothetical protein